MLYPVNGLPTVRRTGYKWKRGYSGYLLRARVPNLYSLNIIPVDRNFADVNAVGVLPVRVFYHETYVAIPLG